MSHPDEGFLARWTRRKQAARDDAEPAGKDAARETDQAPSTDCSSRHEDPPCADAGSEAAPAPVDPASLPSIDDITAASDIRAFLAPGVPAELTRAALRRAWSADPAIRDFIGIAENQWDFTAPDAMVGFGPLDAADDVRRLVEDILGDSPPRRDTHIAEAAESAGNTGTSRPAAEAGDDTAAAVRDGTAGEKDIVRRNEDIDATQYSDGSGDLDNDPDTAPRRGHGGALPR